MVFTLSLSEIFVFFLAHRELPGLVYIAYWLSTVYIACWLYSEVCLLFNCGSTEYDWILGKLQAACFLICKVRVITAWSKRMIRGKPCISAFHVLNAQPLTTITTIIFFHQVLSSDLGPWGILLMSTPTQTFKVKTNMLKMQGASLCQHIIM